jgi:hypothetical protein
MAWRFEARWMGAGPSHLEGSAMSGEPRAHTSLEIRPPPLTTAPQAIGATDVRWVRWSLPQTGEEAWARTGCVVTV